MLIQELFARQMGSLGCGIIRAELQSPDALVAYHRPKIVKWRPTIKKASIKVEQCRPWSGHFRV